MLSLRVSVCCLSLPLCAMSFVCLSVYVLACMCCLVIDFIGLLCVGCDVIFVVFVGVHVLFVVCCGAVCCFIGLSCVYVLLVLFCFRFWFCYGLNAVPVCDCVLYVPSLRCSFLFV